jgi:phosphoribosyl 1,2-cyclic phosphodiesterase
MELAICGVRGSTPAPGAQFAQVGGNTSCIAVTADGRDRPTLVLDAGTGLAAVGALLGDAPFLGTILLGHLHWDHTHGLPFFPAGDRPDASARVLVPAQGAPAIDMIAGFMSPPAFPIGPLGLRGAWSFEELDEGLHSIESFEVLAREIPHKGGRTFGYRVSDGQGTVTYMSDHGPLAALGPGPDGWGEYHTAATALCEGSDLLVHDAHHTAAELVRFASFGHACGEYAVELARRCGVPRVLLFHHAPGRTDAEVAELESALQLAGGPQVEAAREGCTVTLRRGGAR